MNRWGDAAQASRRSARRQHNARDRRPWRPRLLTLLAASEKFVFADLADVIEAVKPGRPVRKPSG